MGDDIRFRVGLDDATEKGVEKVRRRFDQLGKIKPEKTALDHWAEALKGTGLGQALDRYRDLGRRAEAVRKAIGVGLKPAAPAHLDHVGSAGADRFWRSAGGGPRQTAASLDKAAESMGRFRKAAGSAYSDLGNAATQ